MHNNENNKNILKPLHKWNFHIKNKINIHSTETWIRCQTVCFMLYHRLDCIILYYIMLHYIILHYIVSQTRLHYIILHYIILHYIIYHYIILHYITLHYIILDETIYNRIDYMRLNTVHYPDAFGTAPWAWPPRVPPPPTSRKEIDLDRLSQPWKLK